MSDRDDRDGWPADGTHGGGPRPARPRGGAVVVGLALGVALLAPRACTDPEEGYGRTAQVGGLPLPELQQEEQEVFGRFQQVAAVARAAVVRIESMSAPAATAQVPEDIPPFFEDFFGPLPDGEGGGMPSLAGGSGFIVSPDGHIVTNAHVVQGGDVTVWLDDRRSFPAELVGLDRTTDVALLDIDAEGLPTLPFAPREDLAVGDWVLAIGSPGVGGGQLEQTVTAGIVSALGRPLQLLSQGLLEDPQLQEFAGYAIEDFIQTDAVINPGNSGGPLVDMRGRVVGINTAIASPTGYYLGYGFAVPADLVSAVVDDLLEFGEVRRAQLGVNVTTVTPEDAEYFSLPEVSGVLVQDAAEGGPAAEAGLRQGDVIVSLDGQPIERSAALQRAVAERSPGDRIELGIVRDGERMTVAVTLGETDLPEQVPDAEPPSTEPAGRLGLALGELTSGARTELGYPASLDGALVVDVVPLSPAHRRGIVPGSVIVEVEGEPVESTDEAVDLLGRAEPGEVTAMVVAAPGGTERLVTLRVPG